LFTVAPDGSGYNNSNYMTFANAVFLTNVLVKVDMPTNLGNGTYVLATNAVGFTTSGSLTFATNSGSLGADGSGVVSVVGNDLVLTVTGVTGGPVAPSPTLLTNSVSGSTFSLSWPAGQGWRLQQQTNSLERGLSTNWVYVTGTNVSSTNIPLEKTKPAVFYRLVFP
jgi:hypothetical protein